MERTSNEDEIDHLVKVIMVGDAGVGKTFLLNRYLYGKMPTEPAPTIGVEFASKTVEMKNKEKIKINFWDTAGQERYLSVTTTHFKGALGALVVYDITKERTFQNVGKWIETLRNLGDPDMVIMLVGNKIDLCEKNPSMRKVPAPDAQNYSLSMNLLSEEVSAVTLFNVHHCFEELLTSIHKTLKKKSKTKGGTISIEGDKGDQRDHCKCC